MALNCELVASEELKCLRDIQRLLQAQVVLLAGDLNAIGLEDIL